MSREREQHEQQHRFDVVVPSVSGKGRERRAYRDCLSCRTKPLGAWFTAAFSESSSAYMFAVVNPNVLARRFAGKVRLLDGRVVFRHRVVEEAARGGDLVLEVAEFILQLLEVLIGLQNRDNFSATAIRFTSAPVSAPSAALLSAGVLLALIAFARASVTFSSNTPLSCAA